MNLPLKTVVLEHTAPDGTHLDWMIEPPGTADDRPDSRVLSTWRIDVDREPAVWRTGDMFVAQRIGDHRRAFLEYEGELTGGRGTVRRVDAGTAAFMGSDPHRLEIELDLAGFKGRVEMCVDDGDAWRVRILERRGGGDMMQ